MASTANENVVSEVLWDLKYDQFHYYSDNLNFYNENRWIYEHYFFNVDMFVTSNTRVEYNSLPRLVKRTLFP